MRDGVHLAHLLSWLTPARTKSASSPSIVRSASCSRSRRRPATSSSIWRRCSRSARRRSSTPSPKPASSSRRPAKGAGGRRAHRRRRQRQPPDAGGSVRLASSIDVPVYIVIVVSPLDRAGRTIVNDDQSQALLEGPLGNLARWTGGEIFAGEQPVAVEPGGAANRHRTPSPVLVRIRTGSASGLAPDRTAHAETRSRRACARSGYFVARVNRRCES